MDVLNAGAAGANVLTGEKAAEFNQRTLLTRLKPKLSLMNYGQKVRVPKNAGDLVKFRRFSNLSVATTAITEGVTPSETSASLTVIQATIKEYGNWISTTDVVDLQAIDDVTTVYAELMGDNAGESLETITRDIVYAGTNVTYANGRLARNAITATDKISEIDVLKMRRAMVRAKVPRVSLPNGKTGWLGFFHTDVITDLMQLPEWKDTHKYTDNKEIVEGVVGEWHGIYFVEYDLAVKLAGAGSGGTVDVYQNVIIGKEAFGVPDIAGKSTPEMITKPIGSSGTSDPLNQRGTVGWKAFMTAVILQPLAVQRYECAAGQ